MESCSSYNPFQCDSCKLTLTQFIIISENEDTLHNFLYNHGVLRISKQCPECGNDMTLNEERSEFRCNKRVTVLNSRRKKVSKQCNKTVSQNKNTFFEHHNLTKQQICRFVAFWICLKPPRQAILHKEINISSRTCVDWCAYLREVCISEVTHLSSAIGGDGVVVEIDEAKIGHRKYNHGRLVEGSWVFGGIERGNRKCFLVPVPTRGSETLLAIIKEYIKPGTTIVSDCWKAYDCLQYEGYKHLTVNHSVNFVDPDTGAHTQNIKRTWREVRGTMPRYGNRKYHLVGHLAEFIFRRIYPDYSSRIHAIFEAIAHVYNGEDNSKSTPCEPSLQSNASSSSEDDF